MATPGELHGYWTAFRRFGSGRVAWQDLLMPTAHLLRYGYPATGLMEENLQLKAEQLKAAPDMQRLFTNPRTGRLYREGELVRNPTLAKTYNDLALAPDPVRLFYRHMAEDLAAELAEQGGLLGRADFESYRSLLDAAPPASDPFGSGLMLCGPAPASSFAVTQLIVAIMARFYPPGSDPAALFNDPLFYHRFAEAQKFAFAQRSRLGDPNGSPFSASILGTLANLTDPGLAQELARRIGARVLDWPAYGAVAAQPEGTGTTHVSVVDADGNAVSITSSVNSA